MSRHLSILAFILVTSCTTPKFGEKLTETPNISEAPSEIPNVSGKSTLLEKPKSLEKPKQITKGMSKSMVLQILGRPRAGTGYADNVEILHYIKKEGWHNNYYFVRLVEGIVESFGPETPAVGPFKPK